MTLCRMFSKIHTFSAAFALLLAALFLPSPARSQAPRPASFNAENYDVSATLDTIRQSISATAKVDFVASEPSANIRVELHPNLDLKEIKSSDGKSVTFERDRQYPVNVLIALPTPVATGGHITLTFTYVGMLANEDNSPVPGVRAAVITHDSAFLLLPARWFPRRRRHRQIFRTHANRRQKSHRWQSSAVHL
jgi:hypothetical protein